MVAPVPPPVPTQPTARSGLRVRIIPLNTITAPATIPTRIVTQVGEPPIEYVDHSSGTAPGDPLRDILQPATAPPPPAPSQQRIERIRLGGNVEAASLINRVLPEYPAIARAAHISGTVVLHAIIAKDGTVEHLLIDPSGLDQSSAESVLSKL